MPSFRLVGAVAVKVLPDTDDFRERLKRQIDKELSGFQPTVGVQTALAPGSLGGVSNDIGKLIDKLSKKKVTLAVDADTREAQKQTKALKVSLDDLRDAAKDIEIGKVFDDASAREAINNLKITKKHLEAIRGEWGALFAKVNGNDAWIKQVSELKKAVPELKKEMAGLVKEHKNWLNTIEHGGMTNVRKELQLMNGDMETSHAIMKNYYRELEKQQNRVKNAETLGLDVDEENAKLAALKKQTAEFDKMLKAQAELQKIGGWHEATSAAQAKENLEFQEDITRQKELQGRYAARTNGYYDYSAVQLKKIGREADNLTTEAIAASSEVSEMADRLREATAAFDSGAITKAAWNEAKRAKERAEAREKELRTAERIARVEAEAADAEFKARKKSLDMGRESVRVFGNGLDEFNAEMRQAEETAKHLEATEKRRSMYAEKINGLYKYQAGDLKAMAQAGDDAAKAELRRRNEILARMRDERAIGRSIGSESEKQLRVNEDNARIELETLKHKYEQADNWREITDSANEYNMTLREIARWEAGELSAPGALQLIQNRRPREIDFWTNIANRELTEADLEWLARDRGVDFNVRLRDKTKTTVGNFLSGASGWAMYGRVIDDVIESLENVDDAAIGAAKTATAIGALGIAGAGTGAVMSSLASSALDVTKISAGMPAVITSLAAAFYVGRKAFEGFGAAVQGNEEALASLVPRAREAATALSDYLYNIGREVPEHFWNNVDGSFEEFLDSTTGELHEMFGGLAIEMGQGFSGIFDALNESADRGEFAKTAHNIVDMFAEMEDAGYHAMDGLARSIASASPLLVDFGGYLDSMAEKWSNFSREAQENNNWMAWAVNGKDQLMGLWDTMTGMLGTLDEIGQIAQASGAPSFIELGEAMQAMNDAVKGEFFNTNMGSIFEGAINGAKAAGEGFYDLGRSAMEQSGWIKDSFETVGDTIGNLAGDVSQLFEDDMFQGGVSKLLEDTETAVNNLRPMWSDLGQVMGEASIIGGEVVQVLSDVAVNIADNLAGATNLTMAVADVIPVLGEFANALIDITHIPIAFFSDVLAGMLEVFNSLPGPIQSTALAVAAGAIAFGKIDHVLGGVRANITNFARTMDSTERAAWRQQSTLTRLGSTWVTTGRNMSTASRQAVLAQEGMTRGERAMYRSAYQMRDSGRMLRLAGTEAATGFRSVRTALGRTNPELGTMRSRMDSARGAVGNFQRATGTALTAGVRPLAGGIRGISSALGGPWMIGLMAAGVAVMDLASDMKRSQDAFDNIKTTIEEFGSSSREVSDQLKSNFDKDIIPLDRWTTQLDNWTASWQFWRDDLTEGMERIGMTSEEMAEAMTGSGEQFDKAYAKMAGAGSKGKMDAALRAMAEIRREYIETSLAAKSNAASMGLTEEGAIRLTSAMDVLQDGTQGTGTELNAMRTSLDVLRGGKLSTARAAMDLAAAEDQVAESLNEVKVAAIESESMVMDANGSIEAGASAMFKSVDGAIVGLNEANAHARDFSDAMMDWGDAALTAGKQVYDSAIQAGDSQAVAARKGMAAMEESKNGMSAILQDLGLTVEEANAMMTDFTGQNWQVELTFMGRTEEFLKAKEIVEAGGNEIDGRNFIAYLKANPGTSVEEIERLAAAGMTWEESEFTSFFGIETGEVDEKLAHAMEAGRTFDEKDYTAMITGDETPFLESVLFAKKEGMSLNGEEFTAVLDGNGDLLANKVLEAKQMGMDFGSEKWVAHIDANNEGFAEAFLTAEALADGLTGSDIEAFVTANIADYTAGLSEAEQLKMNLNGTSAEVTIDAQTDTYFLKLRGVELAAQGLDGKEIQTRLKLSDDEWRVLTEGTYAKLLESYEGKSATSHLEVNGVEKAQADLDNTKAKAEDVDKTDPNVDVSTETSFADTSLAMTMDNAKAVDESDPTVVTDIQDNASKPLQNVQESATLLDETNPDPNVQLGGDPAAVRDDLGHIQRKLDDIDAKNAEADVRLNSAGLDTDLTSALTKLNQFDSEVKWADLRANGALLDGDLAGNSAKLDAFDARTEWADLRANGALLDGDLAVNNAKLTSFDSRTAWADLRANGAMLDGDLAVNNGKLNAFDARNVWADLRANGSGLDGDLATANAKLAIYDSIIKWADLNARDNTASGISRARGSIAGWAKAQYEAVLTSRDGTGEGVEAARSRMRAMTGDTYEATIDAEDNTAGAVRSARDALNGVARGHYEPYIDGDPSGAQAAAWAAQRAINSVSSRTVYIDVVTRKHNSEGGISPDGQNYVFADGGFNPPTYQSFASGGETHMAHISSAQQTYRIWSEKETGGEAYIPLAMSKRTRSTAILRKVAAMFGYSLVDGDAMSGMANAGSNTSGGGGPVFNIVNNNPQAEPTSTTVNRSLAYAGFYGG